MKAQLKSTEVSDSRNGQIDSLREIAKRRRMKILIFTPYLDTLGGGEQYVLQFAQCMAHRHQLTLVWKNPTTLTAAAKRFRFNLRSLSIIPFLPPRSRLSEYDLVFFVSDGSVPFLPFTKSILLFMSPFLQVKGRSLINQFKLKFITYVVCFSRYTKEFIDAEFTINSNLIYPSVTIPKLTIIKKNIILSVGRFTQTLHLKRQDALIDAFIDLEPQLPGWSLIIAGGTEPGSTSFLNQLKTKARGHRISLKTNASPTTLNRLYAQAKIYWHAAGFGTDLRSNPQKAEHFGISIVEAMGQGAVPLVFNAGGPKEIVTSKSGRTWNHLKELKDLSLNLAKNESFMHLLAQGAKHRAKYFSRDKFCKQFYDLIES